MATLPESFKSGDAVDYRRERVKTERMHQRFCCAVASVSGRIKISLVLIHAAYARFQRNGTEGHEKKESQSQSEGQLKRGDALVSIQYI